MADPSMFPVIPSVDDDEEFCDMPWNWEREAQVKEAREPEEDLQDKRRFGDPPAPLCSERD